MGKVLVLILSALAQVNAQATVADMLGGRASKNVGYLDTDLDDVTLAKGAASASAAKAPAKRVAPRKAPAPRVAPRRAPAKPVIAKAPVRRAPRVQETFAWEGSGQRKGNFRGQAISGPKRLPTSDEIFARNNQQTYINREGKTKKLFGGTSRGAKSGEGKAAQAQASGLSTIWFDSSVSRTAKAGNFYGVKKVKTSDQMFKENPQATYTNAMGRQKKVFGGTSRGAKSGEGKAAQEQASGLSNIWFKGR